MVRVLNYCCFLFFLALNSVKHFIFGIKKTYSFEKDYDYTFNKIQHSDGGYQTHIALKLRKIYDAEFGENKILHRFLFPKVYNSDILNTDYKDILVSKKLNYD